MTCIAFNHGPFIYDILSIGGEVVKTGHL